MQDVVRTALFLSALAFSSAVAPCSGADASIPDDSTAGEALTHKRWLKGDARRRAEQLTSLFEISTIELQYAYFEDIHDAAATPLGAPASRPRTAPRSRSSRPIRRPSP